MAEANLAIKPDEVIEIIIRRRWYIIIPLCLALIAGIYLAITLPKVYRAQTMILVEPQRVPQNYVQSLVTTDTNARISTLSQQIQSRTNLEKIIKNFNLFKEPQYDNMFMEDKIANLRNRITIEVTRARRRGADSFSIAFTGKDPKKVVQVANGLASYFIDENLKVREAQAIGTSDFLDDELSNMRVRLEEVEEYLKVYRKKFMGELPEQLETNLRILDRLQEQLGQRQESLRDAKNRLDQIKSLNNQLQESAPVGESGRLSGENLGAGLERLKSQLEELQTRYTKRHPDVVRLKKLIKENEIKLKQQTEISAQESMPGAESNSVLMTSENKRRMIETTLEINNLIAEITDLQKQIGIYQKRVENTPKREQELLSLRRDYQNIQASYSSLLNRKLEAEIAVNMERKQKGEQFRIIDTARLPRKPIKPDMQKLFIFTIGAGLGIGFGIIFLLEYFINSFKKPEEIETAFDIPVIGTIPRIYHPIDRFWQKVNIAGTAFSLIISFILFSGFALLTFKGVDKTLEYARKIINI